MFLLCHLAAGVVLGLLLARPLKDLRAVPACAFGAILPDLIDKPLGHIFLADSLGYGRIYTHTLIVLSVVAFVGALLFWRYRNGIVLALAVGIGSHQVLDTMWSEPVNWFYPFLGPFSGGADTTTFQDLVMAELSEPSEWIFLLVIISFGFLFLKKSWRDAILSHSGRFVERIAVPIGILLILVGALLILSGLLPLPWAVTHLQAPADIALCGLVIVAAGLALAWIRLLLDGEEGGQGEKGE
ncbi:metal-dependent hydrolase [Methanofollis aquaemaris]|uniref:Metal-dependent hydrolase n=1 Tax=Methanofollis aquaemaris TaxID=126734 RepID=A0A8A3S7G9_9EURY|nr:metal-dependent hydrolase [Methanofollis aquaemaris]QSZ67620.1 metal-dependent hydrolase [Methanofollis aquaemaris]